MVMINTKRISKEYGDSTADYEILMDQEYTVEEFINDVLKIYPNNWGEFLISDNPDSFFSAHIEERANFEVWRRAGTASCQRLSDLEL